MAVEWSRDETEGEAAGDTLLIVAVPQGRTRPTPATATAPTGHLAVSRDCASVPHRARPSRVRSCTTFGSGQLAPTLT